MKVVKLDKRHTCHHVMKYYVEVKHVYQLGRDEQIQKFIEWRNWCWLVFGPGVERDWITVRPVTVGNDGECKMMSNNRWSWFTHVSDGEARLYFRDDETLSAFMLQWG